MLRPREHKQAILIQWMFKTHTTAAFYGENAAGVIAKRGVIVSALRYRNLQNLGLRFRRTEIHKSLIINSLQNCAIYESQWISVLMYLCVSYLVLEHKAESGQRLFLYRGAKVIQSKLFLHQGF